MRTFSNYTASALTALITAAAGLGALAVASPASAEKLDFAVAKDCPQPFKETCPGRVGHFVTTDGPLFFEFRSTDPRACGPVTLYTYIDGNEWGQNVVQPGGNDGGYYADVSPGRHLIEVAADSRGVRGGCNQGIMSGWAGTLHVETNQDATDGAT
jgi:hypothetical protein